MQVSAVSALNQNFSGSRKDFGEIIGCDDNTLRVIAYDTASKKAEARRNNINRLYCAIPLAGGVAAAVLTRGNTKILSKEVSGLAAKAAAAVKEAGYWTFLLGTAVAGGMGIDAVSKKSSTVKEFRHNHPVLSFVGDLGLFVAATTFIPSGVSKLYSKLKPQYISKIGEGVESVAGHINSIKSPEIIKKFGETISSRTPGWMKAAGAAALSFAPHLTLLTAFVSSIRSDAKRTKDFYDTYDELRDIRYGLQGQIN